MVSPQPCKQGTHSSRCYFGRGGQASRNMQTLTAPSLLKMWPLKWRTPSVSKVMPQHRRETESAIALPGISGFCS